MLCAVSIKSERGTSGGHSADSASGASGTTMASEAYLPTPGKELRLFLFLLLILAPFLAIAIVGGYGLIVWLLQMINGPPGTVG